MWKTKPLEIGRVTARWRGPRPDPTTLRLRLSHLLAGGDWHVPGQPPATILVVRHMADPRPGRVRPLAGAARVDPAWEAAVRQALADLHRQAARPERGTLPPDATAVLFADEAELLACLALDLSRGEAAARWWWQAILRTVPGAGPAGLVALLGSRARVVPAGLHLLATWDRAAVMANALAPAQARQVLDAVAHAHELALPLAAPAGEIVGGSDPSVRVEPGRGDRTPAPGPAVAPWTDWVSPSELPPALGRERVALLGVALSLYRHPAGARSAYFRHGLRRWWQETAGRPRQEPSQTTPRQQRPGRVTSAASDPAEAAVDVERREITYFSGRVGDEANESARRVHPSRRRKPVVDEAAAVPAGRTLQAEPSRQTGADDTGAASGRMPDAGEANAHPQPGVQTEPTLAEEVDTAIGGVLYLINLMQRLDLPDCFEETWQLASAVGPWGVLELLGRALLAEVEARYAADALWDVLAALSGRERGRLPGIDFPGRGPLCLPEEWPAADATVDAAPATETGAITTPLLHGLNPALARWLALVLPPVRRWLDRTLVEAGAVEEMLVRPGRVYVTATHVDLVMPLDDISLPVRQAGLDVDPGWLPSFGRVVKFHYE